MNEKNVLLNKVEPMREVIANKNYDRFEIKDDEQWAYWAGQIAFYLVSLSKTSNKKFGLLEPFTNKSTTLLVKKTLKDLFERYKHEIDLNYERFKTVMSKVLSYEVERNFLDLKIPFYVGVFDDSFKYLRSKEDE